MTPASGASPVTVSVVVPVKDDASHLRRCLRALAVQTRPVDEIIVVDNASSDDSAAVARAAGARVVRCERPGIPAAASYGYDRAGGELILRLDADCRPSPSWVAAMTDRFARSPRVDVLTGGARFSDGPRMLRAPLAALYLGAYGLAGLAALGHLPLFGSNLAFRRTAWRDVRGRVHRADADLHDDLDLAFHLGERHRIRYAHGAALGISMRPFGDARAFVRRLRRGARTVLVHWPQDFPPIRWTRLALRRILHRLGVPGPAQVRRWLR